MTKQAKIKKKNELLKSIDDEIKETKKIQYGETGNNKYLNETIQTILSSKITYLNALKNALLGI